MTIGGGQHHLFPNVRFVAIDQRDMESPFEQILGLCAFRCVTIQVDDSLCSLCPRQRNPSCVHIPLKATSQCRQASLQTVSLKSLTFDKEKKMAKIEDLWKCM